MIPPRLRTAVLAHARRHDLLRPGPLVVAVSGGADSTALLLLLGEVAPALGLMLHVAHFDHRSRPAAAAGDAAFVAGLAASVGAPIRIGRAERRPASEDLARRARYAFLRRVAAEAGAGEIATGHTRDDQAETVLLHATRGSGLAGIAGMLPSRDGVVRPLLGLSRADTEAICAAAGIVPRDDPSNRSLRFARNRVRRRVLPELERINPRVAAALARLAAAAAAAAAFGDRAGLAALAAAQDGEALLLDALDRLDPYLQEDAVARWWEQSTGRPLSAAHRTALAALAAGTAGSAALDLPGGRALREYRRLVPLGRDLAGPIASDPVVLEADVPVVWGGWTIVLSGEPDRRMPLVAPAPADGLLIVRGRSPGDRIAGGSRIKVQDLFIDAKVPARAREAHPLVADEAGAVWWAVGLEHAVQEEAGARWLAASPPPGVTWPIARGAGSIGHQTDRRKEERHELR